MHLRQREGGLLSLVKSTHPPLPIYDTRVTRMGVGYYHFYVQTLSDLIHLFMVLTIFTFTWNHILGLKISVEDTLRTSSRTSSLPVHLLQLLLLLCWAPGAPRRPVVQNIDTNFPLEPLKQRWPCAQNKLEQNLASQPSKQ